MSEEKLHVLRMLQEGTINYEEALALLNALGEKVSQPAVSQAQVLQDGGAERSDADDNEEDEEEMEDEEEDDEEDTEDDEDEAEDEGEDDDYSRDNASRSQAQQQAMTDLRSTMNSALGQVKEAMREVSHGLGGIRGEVSGELRETMRDVANEVSEAMRTVSTELKGAMRDVQDSEGWGIFPGFGWHPTYTYRSEEQIAVPSEVTWLDLAIQTKNGSIRVVGSEDANMRLLTVKKIQAETEQAARELAETCIEREQGLQGERMKLSLVIPPESRGVSVSFDLAIPQRLLAGLKLNSKNGGITVEKVSGDADLESKNGGLRIVGGKYQRLSANSKNGSIALLSSVQNASIEAKNGSVRCLLQPADDGKLDVQNYNGSITIELPGTASLGCSVDASTTHGAVHVNLPDFVARQIDRHHLSGQTRDHEQAAKRLAITAMTKNGSITIATV